MLAARVNGYRSSDLDELCTSGEVVWVGAGSLGATDGRIRLVYRDQVGLLIPDTDDPPTTRPTRRSACTSENGARRSGLTL